MADDENDDSSATGLVIEVAAGLDGAVDPAAWDALTGGANPFIEHGFLAGLEASGSVGPGTGWVPRHLLVREAAGGRLVGASPLYLKDDSYGEYIFDWGWANAAHRAGIAYYPKLVSAVPFTPATGPRLLVHPDAEAAGDRADIVGALIGGAFAVAERERASGIHWLFCTEREAAELAARGLLRRLTYQFHWDNAGYASFEDFTAALTSKRRKEVRRERARAQAHGLDVRVLTGAELTGDDWDALYTFYRSTIAQRGAIPYLTRGFYAELARRVPERVRAVIAYDGDRAVAGTLNLLAGGHLFGRYWGAVAEYDALHFECCYYRLIDYAIAHGVTHFEAGAQGQHKIARGFLPSATHSAHFIAHPGLRDAIARHLELEAGAVRREMAALAEHGPFKSADSADLPDRSG